MATPTGSDHWSGDCRIWFEPTGLYRLFRWFQGPAGLSPYRPPWETARASGIESVVAK